MYLGQIKVIFLYFYLLFLSWYHTETRKLINKINISIFHYILLNSECFLKFRSVLGGALLCSDISLNWIRSKSKLLLNKKSELML